MTRAYLFVATIRRRSGAIQAVTVTSTSRERRETWHVEQETLLQLEHPAHTIIKSQSKDITDWLTNAAAEISAT